MKIGLLGKDNYRGLGVLTQEYREHLPIYKTLIYDTGDALHNYSDAEYTIDPDKYVDWLGDCDVVITLELPWDTGFKKLREKGVRTVLKVNYEFLPELKWEPDLYFCSSSVNYNAVESANKVLLPDPVDTDKIPFRKREKCELFVHNAGEIGVRGANGTSEIINAVSGTQIPLLLRSQKKIDTTHCPNIKRDTTFYKNYWEMWNDGDVFVSAQKFRATSLPIQEAMASGMPVLCTDMPPFNEFVNFTFPYSVKSRERIGRTVDFYYPDAEALCATMEKLLDTDISAESEKARAYAESISWNTLTDTYTQTLKGVCNEV